MSSHRELPTHLSSFSVLQLKVNMNVICICMYLLYIIVIKEYMSGSYATDNHSFYKDHSKLFRFNNKTCWFQHGTVIQRGMLCKEFFLKSLLNSVWFWSRAQLAINKKQKYFLLPDTQLDQNLILVFDL